MNNNIVFCLSEHLLNEIYNVLSRYKVEVHILDGSFIKDEETFFDAALRDLPMGDASRFPEYESSNPKEWVWAGFQDFLWQGLSEQSIRRQAIIWKQADRLLVQNAKVYNQAIESMQDVAENLLPESETKQPIWEDGDVDLKIFLIGNGTDFLGNLPSIKFVE